MKRQVKMFAVDNVKADVQKGEISGHAAVFSTIDLQGDIIQRGAFKTQLDELSSAGRIGSVKLLWQHDVMQPIGKCLDLAEDEHGLFFRAQMTDLSTKADHMALIADGVVDKMSIGFDIVRAHELTEADPVELMPGWKVQPRSLDELKLWEVSPVTFPAHWDTDVALAKGHGVPLVKGEDGRYGVWRPDVARVAEADLDGLKAGAVLSATNKGRLRGVLRSLKAAVKDIDSLLKSAEAEKPKSGRKPVLDKRALAAMKEIRSKLQ